MKHIYEEVEFCYETSIDIASWIQILKLDLQVRII